MKKPTIRLIQELCAGNGRQAFIENAHHGLAETPLGDFYNDLNLDEVVAFAAASWADRSERRHYFHGDIYDIFSQAMRRGMPWLNATKQISPDLQEDYQRRNPFGRNLQERLQQVGPRAARDLIKKLQEDPNEYVFECQYQQRKMMRGGDNHKLEIMTFQNVFPKRGRIIPAYATEIAKMLKGYPTEPVREPTQPGLF